MPLRWFSSLLFCRRLTVLVVVVMLLVGGPGGVLCLVVDHPCCSKFLHVPAAFGPDILHMDMPIRSRQLVVVEPEDACGASLRPISSQDLRGKVALIKRDGCNFTEKVWRAQQAEAAAVVVYDSVDQERWGTIMSGVEEWANRITIPSVFVSYSTGLALKNAATQPQKSSSSSSSSSSRAAVLVTLNDTGHVKPKTKHIGPIETLATYVVVSLVLLSFSGCCGLLLALCVTCYQRAFRQRALRGLKVQKYYRRKTSSSSSYMAVTPAAYNDSSSPSSSMTSSSSTGRIASSVYTSSSSSRTTTGVLGSLWSLLSLRRKPSREQQQLAKQPPSQPPLSNAGGGGGGGGGGTNSSSSSNSSNHQRRKSGDSWEEEDQTVCAICLDEYEDGDTLRLLPCAHAYHDKCILPWLLEKSEMCPMCKRPCFSAPNKQGNSNSTSGPSSNRAERPAAAREGYAPTLDVQAIDEVLLFLTNNLSLMAMVLVGVVTCSILLGAVALLRPDP